MHGPTGSGKRMTNKETVLLQWEVITFPRLKTGKRRRQMYRVYWDSWTKTGTTMSLSSGEAGVLEEQPLPERTFQVEREGEKYPEFSLPLTCQSPGNAYWLNPPPSQLLNGFSFHFFLYFFWKIFTLFFWWLL